MLDNRIKILITESKDFSPDAQQLLDKLGNLILADLNREQLLSAIENINILWIRMRHKIDAEVMAQAPNLKVIVSPTTGLNHIDIHEANRRGIRLFTLKDEIEFLRDIRATAEYTIGLMLSLLRNIPAASMDVKNGGWDRDQFKGRELYLKTIGIVGYGRLGRIVARYLKAFDTNIIATDPNVMGVSSEFGVDFLPLDDLLTKSDIVTLHVDLSNKTQRFFGKHELGLMKKGSFFINTSRGELLDEDALLHSLRSRRIAGAALDVLCGESSTGMGYHHLVKYSQDNPNLMITPHIGGATVESMEKTELFLAKKLYKYIQNGEY